MMPAISSREARLTMLNLFMAIMNMQQQQQQLVVVNDNGAFVVDL